MCVPVSVCTFYLCTKEKASWPKALFCRVREKKRTIMFKMTDSWFSNSPYYGVLPLLCFSSLFTYFLKIFYSRQYLTYLYDNGYVDVRNYEYNEQFDVSRCSVHQSCELVCSSFRYILVSYAAIMIHWYIVPSMEINISTRV